MNGTPRILIRVGNALRGIGLVFLTEQSFRVQFFFAIVVVAVAWFFHVTKNEWIVLLLLIGAVLSLELLNSVLERLVDAFKPRLHPFVKDAKDAMAGVVLFASVISAIIGTVIFMPYCLLLVTKLG
jgi:diacylglycerol kinase